jgi:signal transduction histidine kinase/CheY-like chemotaxis protein
VDEHSDNVTIGDTRSVSAKIGACTNETEIVDAVRDFYSNRAGFKTAIYLRGTDGALREHILDNGFTGKDFCFSTEGSSFSFPKQVLKNGEELITLSREERRAHNHNGETQVHGQIWLPIISGDEVVGTLGGISVGAHPVDPRELSILRLFAEVIGLRLDKIEEQQVAERYILAQNDVTVRLSDVESLDSLVRAVEGFLNEKIDFEHCGLYFRDYETQELRLFAAKGFSESQRVEAERTAHDRHPGHVMRSGEPLHIPDTRLDSGERTKDSPGRQFKILSRCYLPCKQRGTTVGTLGLASTRPNAFSPEDISTLQFFTNLCGVLYDRLYTEDQHRKIVDKLNHVAVRLSAVRDVDVLAETVYELLDAFMPVERGVIYFLNERGDGLKIFESVGLSVHARNEAERTAMERHPGRVLRTGSPIIVSNIVKDAEKKTVDSPGRDFQVLSRCCLPITVKKETIGVLALAWEAAGAFSEQDVSTLQYFANLIGVIYARLRSEEDRRHEETKRLGAEAENAAKTRFLASMSHEIRTPMNAVLGYAQLLKRDKGLSPRQYEHLETIDRAGEHLLTLINGVLDMAKIESGQTTLNSGEVDFHQLLLDVKHLFMLRADEANIELCFEQSPDLPKLLYVDSGKVQQILINLVGNALKFMTKGRIVVRVRTEGWDGNKAQIVVFVEDMGPGIEPEALDTIFDAFAQAKAGTEKAGTGLGLAVSRKFAQLLEGSLTVTSVLGEGSTFRFAFQAQVLESRPVIVAEPERRVIGLAGSGPPPYILIVDDVKDNREVFAEFLELVGFEVRTAASGEVALSIVAERRPDVVLLDFRMPEMNGVEVLNRMRALKGGDILPIIFVTASVLDGEQKRLMEHNVDAILSKPVRAHKLYSTIQGLIDVDYRYDDEIQTHASGATIDNAVVISTRDLPQSLVTELRAAVECGDFLQVDRIVREIVVLSPSVGEGLLQLSERFDYDTLLSLLAE